MTNKMEMFKNNIAKLFVLMVFLSLLMVSCEESKLTDDTPDQLFRPVNFIANLEANGVVIFTWIPIANASYSLEISQDSLIFENNLQVFSIDGAVEYTVENLLSNTRYSARIKAVSKNSAIKNSGYKQITFMTGN